MSKYSEIEIQTAKRLHDAGYKWLARDQYGGLFACSEKPRKTETHWEGRYRVRWINVAGKLTPIFQGIKWADIEPIYIEDIINPQILDDAERRYLERVLRPLPKVKSIKKIENGQGEYLSVIFKANKFTAEYSEESLEFPYFETGTMYKGMIADREYTPKELGLNVAICGGAKMEEEENEA